MQQFNSEFSKDLLDNSIAGIFITTLNGEVRYFNKSFAEIFRINDFMNPSDLNSEMFYADISQRSKYIDTLVKSGSITETVFHGRRLNGEFFYYRLNSKLIEDDEKNTFILGSLMDITTEIDFQNKLEEEKNKYIEYINNSVQFVQSFDKNGNLLFCNDVWYKKFKFTPEDIKSLNLFDIIDESSKEHCQMLLPQIFNGKAAFDIDVVFKSKTGEKMLFKGNIIPLLKDGEFIVSNAFFHDVTELKNADLKIKEQQTLLNTILNTTPVCLYLKNHQGQYLFSNQFMQESIGCNSEGKYDSEIFHEQNFELLGSTDQEAILNPDKVIHFNFSAESELATKYFYCGKKSMLGIDGNPLIFGYSVDITDLKQKSLKIEENQKILNSLIQSSNAGFILMSYDSSTNDFEIIYKNDYLWEDTGMIANEENKNIFQNCVNASVFRKLADTDQDASSSEFKNYANGKFNYYHVNYTKIKDDNFKQIKIAIIVNEITEKVELINALEQKLGDNTILVGEIHHRVKNNLSIIDGILELNKYKIQDDGVDAFLSDIQTRIKTIAIVHEKLYKSDSFSNIFVEEYITEIASFYKKMFEIRNIKSNFRITIPENVSLHLSKAISFGLLISELISNSLKYGHSNNKIVEIHIGIEKSGDNITLEYSDKGRGLPENFDIKKSNGFGFKLILNLIKQLKAEYKISTSESFKFNLELKN